MALSYRNLISEKTWLKVQSRARKLRVTLYDLNLEGNKLVWKVTSGTTKNLFWDVTLDISQVDLEYKLTKWSFNDMTKTLRELGLKVWCSDPSFWYWGSAYRAQKYGYAAFNKPKASRPTKGLRVHNGPTVCKHIYAVLSTWPFWSTWFAKRFKSIFEKRLAEKYSDTQLDNPSDSAVKPITNATKKFFIKSVSVNNSIKNNATSKMKIADLLDSDNSVEDILRRLE